MTVAMTFNDDETAIHLAALLSAAVADREDNFRQTDPDYENLLVDSVVTSMFEQTTIGADEFDDLVMEYRGF